MRIKSAFPPICFESPLTKKKWIVCTGGKESSGWIEVNRWYSWSELEKMWDKIQHGTPKTMEKQDISFLESLCKASCEIDWTEM